MTDRFESFQTLKFTVVPLFFDQTYLFLYQKFVCKVELERRKMWKERQMKNKFFVNTFCHQILNLMFVTVAWTSENERNFLKERTAL